MLDATLRIYGAVIRVQTDSELLAGAAAALVRAVPGDRQAPVGPRHDLVVHAVSDPERLPRRSDRAEVLVSQPLGPVGDAAGLEEAAHSGASAEANGEWTVSREAGRTLVELTSGVLAFDGTGSAEAWILDPANMAPEELDGYLFLGLCEQLRYSGLYAIHAAALERDGVGILVPAPSGSGKTTCMLALVDAGWRCVSDDHPLLRDNGDGVELLPFPRPIKITADTLTRFPRVPRTVLREETYKLAMDPEHLHGPGIGHPCRASLVLFPHIVEWPHSAIEGLSRSRALEEIMRLGLLVLDRDVAAAQFQALARLVRGAACYRLLFGSDMKELPAVIESALEGVA